MENTEQNEDLPKEGDGKEATAQLSSLDTQVTVMGSEYDHANGIYKASVPEDLACEVYILDTQLALGLPKGHLGRIFHGNSPPMDQILSIWQ